MICLQIKSQQPHDVQPEVFHNREHQHREGEQGRSGVRRPAPGHQFLHNRTLLLNPVMGFPNMPIRFQQAASEQSVARLIKIHAGIRTPEARAGGGISATPPRNSFTHSHAEARSPSDATNRQARFSAPESAGGKALPHAPSRCGVCFFVINNAFDDDLIKLSDQLAKLSVFLAHRD